MDEQITKEQVADMLAESAQYIEDHAWTRQILVRDDGSVCSVGAMVFSQHLYNTGPTVQDLPIVVAGCRALLDTLSIPTDEYLPAPPLAHRIVSAVTEWNDYQVTGVQEVLDTFRKAEKIQRAGFDPDA